MLYRLSILQLASKILPQIGSNSWSDEKEQHGTVDGEEADWEELRPSGKVTRVLLAYRQTIFVTVYSHLLRKSFAHPFEPLCVLCLTYPLSLSPRPFIPCLVALGKRIYYARDVGSGTLTLSGR